MTSYRWTGAFALALFAFFAFAISSAAAQQPVEAFGGLPAISQPAMAPDGKHYAVVQAMQGKPIIAIYTVGAPEATKPALVSPGDGRIASLLWAKPDRLIVILKANMRVSGDNQMRTWWRAIAINARGKQPAILLSNVGEMRYNTGASAVTDIDLADPDHVFMPLWVSNNGQSIVLNLYRVDVNTGVGIPWHFGTIWTAGYIMDGNGSVVARIDTYVHELKYHIKVPSGHDWVDIGSYDLTAGGDAHVVGVTQDGKGLAMEMPSSSKTVGLFRVDLGTKAITPLFSNPSYDVNYEIGDEWTGRVLGVTYIDDRVKYVYFDAERQRMQGALERTFPGRTVTISTCDAAVSTCIVATSGPKQPAEYFLLDVRTMHTTPLGSSYPQIAEADLGDMRPYGFTARDGLTIPAYLTLPPSRGAKNLPLVVMPHGGPDARDYMAFDWWAQFLANRGYAVLQPNFRGSAGYGGAFTTAGAHQWGLKMQDDLADGVAKLVADGIADPKRVCIVGASYGGYAALAGAAFTPDIYACAVSFAGISDLKEMLRVEERDEGRESVVVSFLQSRIGDRHNSSDEARIEATSPALHADRIKIPVLLLHATGDTTVPIAQSKEMRDALARANKSVQFIELSGDDHYLDLAATRIRVLSEIEKFLAANIGH